ncbi:YybS family protein [Alteribacillus sp. HJP-4]|uniref:YybS family protein n=1 Tax=Alteribacillus sp. HJP-4 TaxID=2775394 RepID=UPI0035CCDBEA
MQRTKRLTEGAVLSGLYIVLLLLVLFIPFLGTILLWFLPLPFIIYVVRHGLKPGLLMFTVTLLLSILIGAGIGLPFTLLAGAGGVTAGTLIHMKKEALLVLAGTSIANISALTLLYAGSVLILDIDPLSVMQDIMRDSVTQAESMLGAMGQEPSENLDMFNEMITQVGYMGPLIIAFTGIAFAGLSQGIAHIVLRRLKTPAEPFPPFREWNFPRSLLWYYLITSIIFYIGMEEEGSPLFIVVWNLFPLLETAMAIQGFSVVFYYCYKKSITKAVPIIMLISGLVLPIILLFARILGIIDLGFHLKKRMETDKK